MPISQYILNANEQQRLNLRLRNKWLIRIRWYYIVLLAGIAAVSTAITTKDTESVVLYITICGFGLLANFTLWAVLALFPKKSVKFYRSTAVLQLLTDLLLASAVITYQGGLDSRATALYALPILAAGILFRSWLAYTAATLSAITYSLSLVIAEARKGNDDILQLLVPIIFYGSFFFILAAITARFTAINSFNERRQSYGELLALLRHELHHPVGVIAALVEMLEHSESFAQINPADRTFVRQIKYENQRMHMMISNLLEAGSKKEKELNFKLVNVVDIVDTASINCATSMKRLKDLESQYSGQALFVKGSEEQLHIAINNLIDNAFRYSERGKKVVVAISEMDDDIIEIQITDEGQGLNKNQMKNFFDQFNEFETDNDGQEKKYDMYSMGLGLYVSKLIIEQHKGELTLKTEPQMGTRATIHLKKEK
jgi:signal transduction histidine kinase